MARLRSTLVWSLVVGRLLSAGCADRTGEIAAGGDVAPGRDASPGRDAAHAQAARATPTPGREPASPRPGEHVSIEQLSGGAHANNALACRTFDRRSGKELRLGDVFPASSTKRVLRKVQALLSDPDLAIDVLGEDLDADGFALTDRGFRVGLTESSRAAGPDVILCAEGPYPRRSSAILEISVDRIPAGYLLR